MYIDIMGFDEKAKKEAALTGHPVEDIRLLYRSSIEIRLNTLKEENVILHFQRKSDDSWLLLVADTGKTFKIIKYVLITGLEFEIAIDVRKLGKSKEEELIMLNDDVINFLKSNTIKHYKDWYREINKVSSKETFVLLTTGAYDDFGFKQICVKPDSSADYYLCGYKEYPKDKEEMASKPILTPSYNAIFGRSYSGEYINLQSPSNEIWPSIFSITVDLPTPSYVFVEVSGSVFLRNASAAFALQVDKNNRDITTHRYCHITANRDEIGNNLPPIYATLGFQDSKVFYLSAGKHVIYLLGIVTDLVQQDSSAQVNFMTFSIVANQNGSIGEESVNVPSIGLTISISDK